MLREEHVDWNVFAAVLIQENKKVINENEPLNERDYFVIKPLIELLYERLIDDVLSERYSSPIFQHYTNGKIWRAIYRNTISLDDIVTDFIANMTETYFIDVCKNLHLNDSLLDKLNAYL